MVLKGWELGVAESISVVVVIGLSVDYVVHLASDYHHSAHPSKNLKMKQAYTEMGVSILAGTITTFGSAVFLFGG
jgi:predicted RND superfamily exporter protein